MQNTLKGWLADNTVTTDNKDDKILLLESAGSVNLDKICEEMKNEDTGLRTETIVHVVTLFLRIVARFILNGYSVNTSLFRAVAQFTGVIEGGKWDPEKNSVYVSFIQDKMIREEIAKTTVNILGMKADVMYILETEDKKSKLKDGSATAGRNFFVRGAMLKVMGDDPSVGVTLTDEKGVVKKLEDDEIAINKPSELTLLIPADLTAGTYTLTVTTQYCHGGNSLLKEPRSVSTTVYIGGKPSGGGEEERPGEL
ncbi:DNA-binding domain-containing protein [uncultured Parabacteroides sp.]|uniref:DNA-binding domain-containing protein n=1 Tax=uncultured Parabacteroides sp. TaxID=512312 RepID=UPI00262618BE|nr:DNA-binding domain-containing protein [uncultured Parabacteroides sp.]